MPNFHRVVVVVAVLFCVSLPFSAGAAASSSSSSNVIVVDPTAKSNSNFNLQTTLAGALQNIKSQKYLKKNNATITLSSNCLNTTQYLTTNNSEIDGSKKYQLTIQYVSPYSPVAQASDCSQLPTVVVIGPNSQLQFSTLSSLTLQGLNIQYSADLSITSSIYEVNQVIFSNVCFNNSEPTQTLPSGYQGTYFGINLVNNCTINNMVFLSDAIKYVSFLDVQQLTFANLTYIILPWTNLTYNAPLTSDTDTYTNTSISMSSVRYVCNPSSNIMNYLILFADFETFTLTNMTFTNCNFVPLADVATSLIAIQCVTSVIIDGVNATNVTLETNAFSGTGAGTSAVSLLDIRNALTIQLSNFILSNVSFGTSFLGMYDDTCNVTSTADIAINEWIISDSNITDSANLIQAYCSIFTQI